MNDIIHKAIWMYILGFIYLLSDNSNCHLVVDHNISTAYCRSACVWFIDWDYMYFYCDWSIMVGGFQSEALLYVIRGGNCSLSRLTKLMLFFILLQYRPQELQDLHVTRVNCVQYGRFTCNKQDNNNTKFSKNNQGAHAVHYVQLETFKQRIFLFSTL